jgi:hypothetical protein
MKRVGKPGNDKARRPTPEKRRKRPWPVTAVGWLILLQGVGLFDLGLLHVGAAYLAEQVLAGSARAQLLNLFPEPVGAWLATLVESVDEELLVRATEGRFVSVGLIFVTLSVAAILAGFGLLRLRRSAWISAMLAQGLSLLIALILYFTSKPLYVYAMMLCGILVVLYLNYYDVRVAFQPGPKPVEKSGVDKRRRSEP